MTPTHDRKKGAPVASDSSLERRSSNFAMSPVSSHFSHILRQTTQDPEVALIFLRQLWPGIVGKPLAPKTEPLSLKNGTLSVGIPPGPWKQQLAPLQGIIARRINESWGVKLVERIELKIHLSERGRQD